MVKLPLCYFGHPVLRKKCAELKEITDEIRTLVDNLKETISPPYDVGISAPQVGKPIRLFITNVIGEDENWHPLFGEPQVFINPVLSDPSDTRICVPEGCLSIPGVYGDVWRPESITIEAMDIEGNLFKERATGYRARVIMHENDHINGVLFIDRLDPKDRRRIEHSLQAIKRKYRS
ncbi:MAG: peptide deformylase [Simkaniaceae bacterium]|nr:peptide deformylase [Simkaniaceae bacterium]MCF7851772.1 peptide deformylase [Simkaniaceae bacterium]